MKKKGFTLIELLAVIVILAIIALIATPIVMNVIENSKKGAAERSAENYLKAVETAIGIERIDGNIMSGEYTIDSYGNLCHFDDDCIAEPEKAIKIEMSGNKPSSGTIFIENGKVVEKLTGSTSTETTTIVTKDNYTVNYNGDGKLTATKNGEKEEEGGNQEPSQGGDNSLVVYRWSDDVISIEQEIDPTDTTKFTTDPTTLGKNYYLKHELDKDNKVTATYACAKFNGVDQEICVRGGQDENGNSYYNENRLILQSLLDTDLSCQVNDDASYCYEDSLVLDVNSNGNATARVDVTCFAFDNGTSMCASY